MLVSFALPGKSVNFKVLFIFKIFISYGTSIDLSKEILTNPVVEIDDISGVTTFVNFFFLNYL